MSGDDKQRRYEEIMRKIAGRQPFNARTARTRADQNQNPPDRALDLLNAYDSFSGLTQVTYPRILCHGPKALRAKAWSAVVVWHRPKGYHGYQKLTLFGVWAHTIEETLYVSIGQRELAYRAPIFDAGVYRVAIENGFRLYYEDAGGPPGAGDQVLYQAPFDKKERLAQRRTLSDMLATWQSQASAP